MTTKTYVIGVGMTKFEKPGGRDWDYPEMGSEAAKAALEDAGITYDAIERAFAGYCAGESCSGQRAVYDAGMTGIPIINVNNNCATGSSALYLARESVRHGQSDVALAVGFEKMAKGSIQAHFNDREAPLRRHIKAMWQHRGRVQTPIAAQMFGNAAKEYMERYGVTTETIARVAEKNHRHSVNNPRSQFQEGYSLKEILDSPMISDPLTRLQCCPTSDGGAAAVVASERFVEEHGLWDRAIEIAGQALVTDRPDSFDGTDRGLVGFYIGQEAARQAYEQSGFGPEDAQVVELHDCFASAEMITYEALGLCPEGKGGDLINDGATTYGGTWVVNPSGGLIAKGHPLGATGLAQCSELTWQLRGTAGKRQVDGAKVGIQHNLGLGGAGVVTVYARPSR
jgi:acetyl-CoA acetyltransferase